MHTDEDGVSRITERVIGGAFQVLNTLGVGFLERVYENALVHELRKRGLDVVQQHGVNVIYDGVVVGAYNVDLLVEGSLIVGLKAVKELDGACRAMPQLSEGDRTAFLPAVELRQVSAGDPANCSRLLTLLGISVCICVHLWLEFLAYLLWPGRSIMALCSDHPSIGRYRPTKIRIL